MDRVYLNARQLVYTDYEYDDLRGSNGRRKQGQLEGNKKEFTLTQPQEC